MSKNMFSLIKTAVLCLQVFAACLQPWMKAHAENNSLHTQQIEKAVSALLEPRAAAYAQQLGASNYEVRIKPISNKLGLTPCSTPVTIENLSKRPSGPQKLKATCNTPQSWKVYIQATITIKANVLVAITTLQSGMPVTANDVMFQEIDINELRRGFFTSIKALEGMTTKRTIRSSTLITPNLLKEATLINKGNRVSIVSEVNGIIVQMPGIALEDGAKDNQIRAKNISSGKVVFGRVRDNSSILVSG